MQRLSGLDTAFLALEGERWPTHVACVTIFDPKDCPGGYSAETFKRSLEERLHLLPPLRWRLVEPPLGLGRPYWINDPDFDLGWHVRRVGLPQPGGRYELAELCSEIYRHRLDRRRPLWELWLIEGLEDGHVAVFWKIHHACIDGMSGAAMQEVMFDRSPEAAPIEPPSTPWQPEQVPHQLNLLLNSLPSFAATPLRLGKQMVRFAQGTPGILRAGRDGGLALRSPRTSFNQPVSQHRAWGFCRLSLNDLKAVKNSFGTKLNDVVLTVVGGALRHYLLERGELPEAPLVASVPVNVRGDARPTTGNVISGMPASLATHIADPVERLAAVHAGTQASKLMQQAMGADALMNLVDTPPPMMLSLALRFYGKTQLVKRHPVLFNLPVSNVPGPARPLYVQGAPIKAFYSMGIVFDGAGLFIGGMSYQDCMDFGVLACKELVPDPFVIADAMVEELAMLVKAADRHVIELESPDAVTAPS
jgi:WS/DGAT/MGAT family acyltransferase